MPRARRTQTGAPALPIQSVPGRRYGEGPESAALQRSLPAPAAAVPATPPPVGQPVADGSASGQEAPVDPAARFAAALAAAQQVNGAGLLTRPTERPQQPVTAGLSTGPGPGPEIIPPVSKPPIGQFWRELSRVTGDPFYAQLADRAGV